MRQFVADAEGFEFVGGGDDADGGDVVEGGAAGVGEVADGLDDEALGELDLRVGHHVRRLEAVAGDAGRDAVEVALRDAAVARKGLSHREQVVEGEAGADLPCGAGVAPVHGEEQAQRLHEVRGGADEVFALAQGFADEAELAVLEVAEAAVDEAGGAGRRAGAEVVALDEEGLVAGELGFAGDAGAVDAAADDDDVELLVGDLGERWPHVVVLSREQWRCRMGEVKRLRRDSSLRSE